MNVIAPSDPSTPALLQEFWTIANSTRTQTEYMADAKLANLAFAPLDVLRKIFIQYRYFTIYYITDLALLVAKLPFGPLRSLLADFLNDELGNGNEHLAHERLYDDFLVSIGVDRHDLDVNANNANLVLLEDLQRRIGSGSAAYATGLRGMGGECLCQVYLSAMHTHFVRNPAIRALAKQISWQFWHIHTGDIDVAHREKLKAAIQCSVIARPSELRDLVEGYQDAKRIFDKFWDNVYREHFDLNGSPSGSGALAEQGRM